VLGTHVQKSCGLFPRYLLKSRGGEPRKTTRPCTRDAPIGDWSISPQLAGAVQSRSSPQKPVAIHATKRPSSCAHGSGRSDHATPSRPRQGARAGGAACVTAASNQWHRRQHLHPCWKHVQCAEETAHAAASRRQRSCELVAPVNNEGARAAVHVFRRRRSYFSGGVRGVCPAMTMGFFLHAVGPIIPTEPAADKVS